MKATEQKNVPTRNEQVPSAPLNDPGAPQPAHHPKTDPDAPAETADGSVPLLANVPEGPGQGESYAPRSNPDAANLSPTPGITEIPADASSEQIAEMGDLPEGPEQPNQSIP